MRRRRAAREEGARGASRSPTVVVVASAILRPHRGTAPTLPRLGSAESSQVRSRKHLIALIGASGEGPIRGDNCYGTRLVRILERLPDCVDVNADIGERDVLARLCTVVVANIEFECVGRRNAWLEQADRRPGCVFEDVGHGAGLGGR
jgi:hypothetical protein